jgi:O-antigen/teichoic acid export membrane protein
MENISIRTLWITIGSFGSFSLSIVSAVILSRYFDKIDYGTYKQILFIYGTLLVVFSAGIPAVFSYFLPRFSLEEGKNIVTKLTLILFITGSIFSIFLYLFSSELGEFMGNPKLGTMLEIFSPIPMFLLPTLGVDGVFATYGKTHFIAVYEIITRLIMLLCIVLPVTLYEKGLEYAIYGWVVASIASFILALFFKRIPFKKIQSKKANLSYQEIFHYSLPLVVASFWGIAITTADNFYISKYFGVEVYAEFSNGFIEIPFVIMITSAISVVLLPVYSKMAHQKTDIKHFIVLWREVLRKSAAIIYPIVVLFLFYSEIIIILLFSEKYINSALFFQISMMVNFFNIIIFSPLLFALGRTKFYAQLHMFIALLEWSLGYVVVLVFNSPIAIAIMAVSLSILKIIIAFVFTAKFLGTSLRSLIPFKAVISYAIHSILIMVLVQEFLLIIGQVVDSLLSLIVISITYVTLLIVTSIPLGLDYLSIIKRLLNKQQS